MNELELKEAVASNPGGEAFPELVQLLLQNNRNEEALFVALNGLSLSPSNILARFLLSKVYFELGYAPFAARELHSLLGRVQNDSEIRKLIVCLDPSLLSGDSSSPSAPQQVAKGDTSGSVKAEAEFDVDDL